MALQQSGPLPFNLVIPRVTPPPLNSTILFHSGLVANQFKTLEHIPNRRPKYLSVKKVPEQHPVEAFPQYQRKPNHTLGDSRMEQSIHKPYSEQQSLSISADEVFILVSVVCDELQQNGSTAIPKYVDRIKSIAARILIKLLFEGFVYRKTEFKKFFPDLLCNLLESKKLAPQMFAFNLLFNFSLHLSFLSDDSVNESIIPKAPSTNQYSDIIRNAYSSMVEILVKKKEIHPSVLQLSFNLFCFLYSQNGSISPSDALSIPPRIFVIWFSKASTWDFTIQQYLCNMMTNVLYSSPNPPSTHWTSISPFDLTSPTVESIFSATPQQIQSYWFERFTNFAGSFNSMFTDDKINFVIDSYIKARSSKVKSQLFAIIFDYIMFTLKNEKELAPLLVNGHIPFDQVNHVWCLLSALDASSYFDQFFKKIPKEFSKSFVSFLVSVLPAADKRFTFLLKSATTTTKMILLFFFNYIIIRYRKYGYIQDKHNALLKRTTSSQTLTDPDRIIIQKLLTSANPTERREGSQILSKLLEFKAMGNPLNANLPTILVSLLKQVQPEIRSQFLSITDRIGLLYIHRPNPSLDTLKRTLKLYSDHISRMKKYNEFDPAIFLSSFDLMIRFLTCPNTQYQPTILSSTHVDDSDLLSYSIPVEDTLYSDFLNGKRHIPLEFLSSLNPNVLVYIYDNLPLIYQTPRLCILCIIGEICLLSKGISKLYLENSFFTNNVLKSQNLEIALTSSRYYIKILQQFYPTDYESQMAVLKAHLKTLKKQNFKSPPKYETFLAKLLIKVGNQTNSSTSS